MNKKVTIFWLLCVSLVLTVVCFLVYGTVQQVIRQSANDPEIQIAEDSSYTLGHGGVPADVVPHGIAPVEMSRSLAPFTIIFDSGGTVLESSATLDGQIPAVPAVPAGVFDSVRAHGEDRITWQPRTGVRIAAVIVSFTMPSGTTGFILAGRSLREVEIRESKLGGIVLAAWVVMIAFLVVCGFVSGFLLE